MPDAKPTRTPPLALQRARHALEKIEHLPGNTEKDVGKYRSYVEALPANILRSGLGQALAMECAGANKDKDKGHELLFAHMQEWLTRRWPNSPYSGHRGGLLQAIVEGDQGAYVRAQAEALAYLEWLKKFAVAFVERGAIGSKNEDAGQPAGQGQ